jgi:class 3 adenylate cyclase/predicted ATPase
MTDTVERWLEELGLGKYGATFIEHEISFEALPHLTDDDLKELGLPLGPRRVVAAAIAKLSPPARSPPPRDQVPASRDAERRHLTVLFCDLVGSTELSTRLDPEDMRDLLRAYQDACSRAIARYDGYVAKFMGDGVYAYFGYPRAHEDDAERAIRAAIDLVAAVGTLDHPGPALAVRIGIATGPVVVGDVLGQGSAQEAAVTGETPNLAGRLQALADANAIVISEATHRLAGAMFEMADLGPHALKGFSEAVRAWSVIRPRMIESRFDAKGASRAGELVGRGDEFGSLCGLWERAKAGAGQIALVTGEAGIGKSRLVRALEDELARETDRTIVFQCSPYHASSVLYPFIERLQRAARFDLGDDAATKLDKLEALLAPAPDSDPLAAPLLASLLAIPTAERYPPLLLSPPQQKQRTLAVLSRQILGLADVQPLLLVLEDAHWIDPTSIELVDRVLEGVPERPVLALITYRPEFDPPWAARPNATLLALDRLGPDAGMALVERIAQGSNIARETLSEIVIRADGVPLFVEELTKATLEAASSRAGPAPAGSPRLAIPETLQDALMAGLDRLGAAKNVLQAAACIGREFSFPLLSEVTRLPDGELARALDHSAVAELIVRRGDPPTASYAFAHALLQDAARGSLLRSRRAQTHGDIAEALTTRFLDTAASQPEIVAHHLTEAGAVERAIPFWDQAGRNAARKFANTEAIRHFNKALELVAALPDGEGRKRLELTIQINLAPVHMAAKGFGAPEAQASYARSRELAEALQDSSQLFTSTWGLWIFNQMQPRKGTARALTKELLALSTANGNSGQVLQAHHASWTTSFFLGEFAYTREEASRGVSLYDLEEHRLHKFLYGGHDPGVCSHMFSATSAFVLGFPDAALATMRDGLRLAERMDHPLNLLLGHLFLAIIHLFRREAEAAAPILDDAIRIATDGGIPRGMWANLLGGWALAGCGRPAEGLERALTDFDAPGAAGQEVFRPYYFGVMADMARAAGRFDEGLAFIDKGRRLALSQDSQWCLAELDRIEGELRQARGEPADTVERCLASALDVARRQDALSFELRAATRLAKLHEQQGRREEARTLVARVYNRFTDGFDTADLKDAAAMASGPRK